MRSFWKGVFTAKGQQKFFPKLILVRSRASIITENFLGRRVGVYNGNKFVSVIVRPLMLGRRFGEFAPTKKLGSQIHKEGRLSKKKK